MGKGLTVENREAKRARARLTTASFVVLVGTVLLMPWTEAGAQEPETHDGEAAGTAPETVLDVVVVTAARIEESIEDVPSHVTVIDRHDLDGSAALTADDALRAVPGFSLFRRSSSVVAHPTTQGVSLRGLGPSGVSRTLVVLDGVPLNDPFGGWVYWGRVPRFELERVELVRGGASSVWGNYALGGVIQLLTDRGRRDDVLGLHLAAGERATYRLEASGRRGFSWGSIGARVEGFDTDGYYILRGDQRGAIDVPATSDHQTYGATLHVDPTERWNAKVALDRYEEERGNGTFLTGNDTELDGFALSGWFMAAGEWGLSVHGQDQSFGSRFSSAASDRSSERPALDQFDVPAEALAIELQWHQTRADRTLGGVSHAVSGGLEWRQVEGETNELFFFTADFNRQRQAGGEQELGGLWLRDAMQVGERIELVLGARIDRWESRDGFRLETERVDGSVRLEQRYADRRETEVSPRLGLVFDAGSGGRLFASLYRAFRAPTVNELYRPFRVGSDITAANPLLVPESVEGLELGGSWSHRRWQFEATGFANQLEDAVANVTLAQGPGVIAPCGFTPGGGDCRQRQNLGEVRVQGLEFDVRGPLSDRLSLAFSLLWTDSEIKAAPVTDLVGLGLAQVPEQQASLRLDWQGPVRLVGEGRYVDAQWDDPLNTRRLGDAVIWGLRVSRSVQKKIDVFLALENVTDEKVETGISGGGLVNIGAPRLFHAGVNLRFGE